MKTPFVREWLRVEHVLCYRFYEMSPMGMDSLADDAAEVARTWSAYKPLPTLVDLRSVGLLTGAQVLLRIRQVAWLRPKLRGRTALVIGSPVAAQVASGVMRTTLPLGMRQRRVFADENEALAWLLESPTD